MTLNKLTTKYLLSLGSGALERLDDETFNEWSKIRAILKIVRIQEEEKE